ncbi:helix-turn-helix domain-containing protein [Lentzea sp. NPDC051208]|uniref:TetR/AcrR family transcriptional regulator n=1 Tax=Lentzea sp. NPDC051208 TaxID=3154642 RepID=UPI00342B1415
MGAAGAGARRPRTDKQRNRAHILEVAEQFFSERGITGSLDAIAKQAGVGPGTLYRHFPNREALLVS